jgi:D-glycero-D-manno-heptose 1,7-bisphosphate phosphatase
VSRRAAFLDRDGVINAILQRDGRPDSPQRPNEFALLPGAACGIRLLNELGLPVVVVSNQPGVAKGTSTLDLLGQTNGLMRRSLALAGAFVDGVYYCLHHPAAALPEYRVACDCRKPRPGLLRQAADDLGVSCDRSYMIGDRSTDMTAGKLVGCMTFLVGGGVGQVTCEADVMCADLWQAANLITELERSGQRRQPTDAAVR